MNKKSNDLLCILLIILFLLIIAFATYIKFTTPKKATNETANESNNIEEITTKNLYCNLIYDDQENTKANIEEEIIIEFNESYEPTQQIETKTYNFNTIDDYNNYKDMLTEKENVEYEEDNMKIIITTTNDYTTPYNSNNETDFRNKTYSQIEEYLSNNEYTCE